MQAQFLNFKLDELYNFREKIRNMDYLKLLGAGAVTLAAVTTTTFYYLTSRPQPIPLLCDLNDQTQEKDVSILQCLMHK